MTVPQENTMIELTMTESAETKLLKVLNNATAKAVRIIQQGYG